jgi:hypothetical protein
MTIRITALVGLAAALVWVAPAKASPVGPEAGLPTLTFTPGISASNIAVGGFETLTLTITETVGTNAVIGGGFSGNLEIFPGAGQLPTLFPISGTGSFIGTVGATYSIAGLFTPTFTFIGQTLEAAIAGFTVPADQSVNVSGNFPSVQVGAAAPEPSTWAMMILGFAGIGFMAYRRKSTALLIS